MINQKIYTNFWQTKIIKIETKLIWLHNFSKTSIKYEKLEKVQIELAEKKKLVFNAKLLVSFQDIVTSNYGVKIGVVWFVDLRRNTQEKSFGKCNLYLKSNLFKFFIPKSITFGLFSESQIRLDFF